MASGVDMDESDKRLPEGDIPANQVGEAGTGEVGKPDIDRVGETDSGQVEESDAGKVEGRDAEDQALPRFASRRAVITFAVAVVLAAVVVYFGIPQLAGLNKTVDRLRAARPEWVMVAFLLEFLSYASYVVLFRVVFLPGTTRIDWRASYQITMAGVAATRLFSAGGAGGMALMYWALRRSGMSRKLTTARIIAFFVLLYAVFMVAMLIDGILLRAGVVPGNAPWTLTVVPAAFGGTVIAAFLAIAGIPPDLEVRLERRLASAASRYRRTARWVKRLGTGPARLAGGTRIAIRMLLDRRSGLMGAPGWWAFDIGVLWACFHAFGDPPPLAVVIMAYYVGMLANTLPFFPGGVGSVDAGMIGAFLAFGTAGDLAVVAVLSYRTFAFWLPTAPGVIAYLGLRKTVNRWNKATGSDVTAT